MQRHFSKLLRREIRMEYETAEIALRVLVWGMILFLYLECRGKV